MLKVTHDAAEVLSSARASTGAPDTFGVRFFVAESTADKAQIGFEFVEDPQPEDAVAEQEGISVYVAPELNEALSGATLDAQKSDGTSQLILRPGQG